MPILFRLRELPAERVAFGYSPSQELLHAMHVLADASHHPLHIPWVVRTRRQMSPTLKREFDFFRELVEQLPLPVLWDLRYRTEIMTFTQEIDLLRQAPKEAFGQFLLQKAQGSLRDQLVEAPERGIGRFVDLLEGFWRECMAAEWPELESRFLADIARRGQALYRGGITGALSDLSPDTHMDRATATLTIQRPVADELLFRPEHQLFLMPSSFAWPHLYVHVALPYPIITYPVVEQQEEVRAPVPPERVLKLLRAAGDMSRLQILQLLAQRPKSTTELAAVIGISEAAISRHLKQLQEVGLVESERQSYYVFYRLSRSPLSDLARGLEELLSPQSESPLP